METFKDFLQTIDNHENRQRVEGVLNWVTNKYPNLQRVIKWNQPMFTNEGTYIIGFSVAKGHMSVSPEPAGMAPFLEELEEKGYKPSAMIFRIPWDKEVDYDLLSRVIDQQIEDKKDYTAFWRK